MPYTLEDVKTNYTTSQLDTTTVEKPKMEDFKSGIAKDIARTELGIKAIQQAQGIQTPAQQQKIVERGIKIGGEIVAQQEFNNLLNSQKDILGKLSEHVSTQLNIDKFQTQNMLEEKMNALRLELTQKAAQFNYMLEKQGADAAKKAAARKMFGSIAGTIAGGVIGSVFAGPVGGVVGAGIGNQAGGALGSILG